MQRNGITPDTNVLVMRTIVVSTQMPVSELAAIANEPVDQVIRNIASRNKAAEWIQQNHLAEMVPRFDYTSAADGDTLDVDDWTLQVVK